MKLLCKHKIDISKFECKQCLKAEISSLEAKIQEEQKDNITTYNSLTKEITYLNVRLVKAKDTITRRNKQIKALKREVKEFKQKIKDILDITNNTDITNIIT